MGRADRRELERLTRKSAPETLTARVKSWVLEYPADSGTPHLKPVFVRALQVVASTIVLLLAWRPWRRLRR